MDFGKAKQNLEERGYKVSVFDTAAEAAAYLDGAIDGTTVSFGGSVTLDQMGLYEKLEKLAAGENVFGTYPYLGLRSHDETDCV